MSGAAAGFPCHKIDGYAIAITSHEALMLKQAGLAQIYPASRPLPDCFRPPKSRCSRALYGQGLHRLSGVLAWSEKCRFRSPGRIRTSRPFFKEFARGAKLAGLAHVLPRLEDTHITHLLRGGVSVHVVSVRAGHAKPSVTLNNYAHLLPGQQEGAAAVVDAAMTAALQE